MRATRYTLSAVLCWYGSQYRLPHTRRTLITIRRCCFGFDNITAVFCILEGLVYRLVVAGSVRKRG